MFVTGLWNSLRLAAMAVCLSLVAVQGASASSGALTYHGRLLKPNGQPVQSSSVQFLLQIRSPLPTNCLMYQEIHTKDLSQNQGVFSLAINDGTATTVNTEPFSLDRVFQNYGEFHFQAGKCSGSHTYHPGTMDSRSLYVSFNDGTFAGWEPLPAQQVSYVPSALSAVSVGGFQAEHLLRVVDASDVPVTIDPWTEAQFQKLLDIRDSVSYSGGHTSITGTSAGFTGSLAGDVTGGQASTKVEKIQGRSVLDSAPSNGQVLTWNHSQARWEAMSLPAAGAPAWNDITGKPSTFPAGGSAGGDLSGTYPDPLIAANAVNSSKIADGSIAPIDLSTSGAVTGSVFRFDSGWSVSKLQYTDLVNNVGGSPWPGVCAAGSFMSWNSGTDAFECVALTNAMITGAITTLPVNKGGTGATTEQGARNNLLPAQSGQAGKILQTDGTNVSWEDAPSTGITSINGATGSSQTFVTAQGETAPVFLTAGSTHTLNIPLASTNGVTSGTISYADYQSFSGKQNALGFTPLNPANNLSELTNTTTARSNLGLGTAATKSFGTAAGNLVELDASGKIPASLIPSQSSTYFAQGGNAFSAPAVLGTTDAQPLHLQTGGANKLSILNNGNVGIGTATPSERLEVAGNVKATQLCIGADCRSAWPSSGGGGTVTSVATGTGLTGGPITGSGTISIASGGVGTTELANGAVTDAKITGVSVNKVNSGSGLYLTYAPNGSACSNGAVLKKTANGWECGVDVAGSSSPLTTKGDIYVHDGSTNVRLPAGSNGKVLKADSSQSTGLAWGDAIATDISSLVTTGIVQRTGPGSYSTLGVSAPLSIVGNNIVLGQGDNGVVLDGGNTVTSTLEIGTNSAHSLAFETAGTTKMTILSNGSVGIGTVLPDASALLDVSSAGKGFLPPRMTETQRDAIVSPTAGLIVYNTTSSAVQFYNGSSWATLGGSVGGMTVLDHGTLSGSSLLTKTFNYAQDYVVVFSGYFSGSNFPMVILRTDGNICGVDRSYVSSGANYGSTSCTQVFSAGSHTITSTYGETSGSANMVSHQMQYVVFAKYSGPILKQWVENGSDLSYSGGNVGVGVSAPADKLDVAGRIRATHICAGDGTNCKDLTTSWTNGAVTSISGTAPVSVTGTSTPVVSLNASGVTAAYLANGAVTSAKILDGTIATADIANVAVTDAKIAGVAVNKVASGAGLYLTYAPNNIACTNGQVLKKTANGWECGADSNSGGTVTSVSGTAPISVATGTTTPAISLAASGVTATHLANGAVTSAKILDNTIVGADIANGTIADAKISGLAATKLSGTIAAANFPALTGDVTNTVGSLSLTVTRIRGRTVASTTPANGQVLKWNNTTSQWEPSVDNNAGGTVTSVSATAPLTVTNGTTTPALALTNGSTTGQMLRWSGAAWVASTDGAVLTLNASNLSSGSIPAARIAASTITSSHIANGTIVAADIANGTVTSAKLATTVANGLWTVNGANVGRPSGNVGIGTTSPAVKLDVTGSIRPGSSGISIGGACTGEGSFAYDISAHTPVFCNQSGVWTAMGTSPGTAKAWVNFDGSACSPNCPIRASHNISSVVQTNTGQYRINFSSAMSNANYVVIGTGYMDASERALRVLGAYSKSTGYFDVRHLYQVDSTSGGAYDYSRADLVVFGN